MPDQPLVLSLFPGIDLLGRGFEEEGFCVIRGPDLVWGGDVREFHPPPGRFDGVIGGDPCQAHSSLANLVRAKGLEPSFPDLTPEFERVVSEAQPEWFLRENVPNAPSLTPKGYDVRSFLLDHSALDAGDGWGHEQMRTRRFWFGVREGECPELRRWIRFAWFQLPDATQSVAADARAVSVRHGGSGKVKVTADGGHDGTADAIGEYRKRKRAVSSELGKRLLQTGGKGIEAYRERQAPVTGRNEGAVGSAEKDYSPHRRTLGDMLELQGMPRDWLDWQPWTVQAKRKLVGNAVPLPMARALARAVRKALEG